MLYISSWGGRLATAPLCIPCEHRFCIPNQCGKENIREMKIRMAATSSLTLMTFS